MSKSKAKPRKAVESALTLADVEPGDTATLLSGATCEVGFHLGASTFVRFSDNHEPRAISGLPSSTAVARVMRRERVASAASEVADPLDSRRKA
jgi:hypothetical protein